MISVPGILVLLLSISFFFIMEETVFIGQQERSFMNKMELILRWMDIFILLLLLQTYNFIWFINVITLVYGSLVM